MSKIPEIVTPGDVDPALVTIKEFGPHSSYQRNSERIWQFKNEWGLKKFLMIGHLKKYKRRVKNGI